MRAIARAARSTGVRCASASAAALGIPTNHVASASQAYLVWSELNVNARHRLESIAATADATNYSAKRHELMAAKSTPAAPAATLKAAVANAKTLKAFADAFEAIMLPVRKLEAERSDLQLLIWGCVDHINLGLNVHTPEQLDKYKKDLEAAKSKLAANRKAHAEYSAKAFDTATCNEVVNLFRIAGESKPNALAYAEFLLDDLTLANVTFDEATKLLLKNVIFGDLPHEDSNLLFSFVENPERGEVDLSTVKNGDLSAVADEAVITIGRRHTTPVDAEFAKLQKKDTHPMLQRSPE
jgi:hypothetical protein